MTLKKKKVHERLGRFQIGKLYSLDINYTTPYPLFVFTEPMVSLEDKKNNSDFSRQYNYMFVDNTTTWLCLQKTSDEVRFLNIDGNLDFWLTSYNIVDLRFIQFSELKARRVIPGL